MRRTWPNTPRPPACPPSPARPGNTFDVSMLPWTDFSGFNIKLYDPRMYMLPIFTLGQASRQEGKVTIPLAIQIHHAVCDGYHIAPIPGPAEPGHRRLPRLRPGAFFSGRLFRLVKTEPSGGGRRRFAGRGPSAPRPAKPKPRGPTAPGALWALRAPAAPPLGSVFLKGPGLQNPPARNQASRPRWRLAGKNPSVAFSKSHKAVFPRFFKKRVGCGGKAPPLPTLLRSQAQFARVALLTKQPLLGLGAGLHDVGGHMAVLLEVLNEPRGQILGGGFVFGVVLPHGPLVQESSGTLGQVLGTIT